MFPSKTYFDNTYSSLTEEEFNALSSQEQSDLYQSVAQKNTRFIVQGKLLENINNLSSQVSLVKNPNPKAPNIPKS